MADRHDVTHAGRRDPHVPHPADLRRQGGASFRLKDRAFQGSHPLPALAGMLGWSRPDSCWARAKSGGSECFGPVRSMMVTRHPVPDAAIPGGEFETGAAPQRVDVCAVELLPRRLADRRGGRRLATATLDFFL